MNGALATAVPVCTSNQLADFLNVDHEGEVRTIDDVGSLSSAKSADLAFCVYDDSDYVAESDAGVVICLPGIESVPGKSLLYAEDPRLSFVKAVNEFFLDPPDETTIHPAATVDEDAHIGERAWIGANVYIGPDVTIGDRCKIQAGTSIGGEGFGYFRDDSGQWLKQIHKGQVIVEDDVEIGSNCSIDRAVFDETVIGAGSKLDNLIHVAHNVTIGKDVWIADTASINGSVTIGDGVRIHPNASIADHITVGDRAEIGLNAGVLSDVDADTTVVGTPAKPI